MRGILLLFMVGLLSCTTACFSQSPVSIRSLLRDMISIKSMPNWPAHAYTLKQASSYDRRSVDQNQSGWFANKDQFQFIRLEENNGRTEYVMMDAEGPGAVVRFWLTTTAKPGMLRIYLDHQEKPVVEIPGFDLMRGPFKLGPGLLNPHSSYNALDKGGNTLYLPIPYQKHCKITWEEQKDPGKQARYYQINYRTYEQGTMVKTFSLSDLTREKKLIDSVEYSLWHPVAENVRPALKSLKKLQTGDSLYLDLPSGPSAISLLNLSIKTERNVDYEQALHQVFLKMEFDRYTTIYCPLDDFSGSGTGAKDLQSWYRTVEKGKITSRWIMPYKEKARIFIINKAKVPISVNLSISVTSWNWTDQTMYFHTSWKEQQNVPIKKSDAFADTVRPGNLNAPIEWNCSSISGKGLYLGNTFNVFNKMHVWYGEGDQKIWVDKDLFPSEFGTGTEDYYNTSWAPVIMYQTPFANAPRADNADSYGLNTFTRTRILDAVPFERSFRFDWEALGWDDGSVNASATIYWYGFGDAQEIQ